MEKPQQFYKDFQEVAQSLLNGYVNDESNKDNPNTVNEVFQCIGGVLASTMYNAIVLHNDTEPEDVLKHYVDVTFNQYQTSLSWLIENRQTIEENSTHGDIIVQP